MRIDKRAISENVLLSICHTYLKKEYEKNKNNEINENISFISLFSFISYSFLLALALSRPRRRNCIPASVSRLSIILRQLIPIRPCHAVQIINHFPLAQRQLASKLLCSPQPSSIHIDEAEVAFLELKHSDIGHCAR